MVAWRDGMRTLWQDEDARGALPARPGRPRRSADQQGNGVRQRRTPRPRPDRADPAGHFTLEDQVGRVYEQYRRQPDDLARYVTVNTLHDRNEVLFYRLLRPAQEQHMSGSGRAPTRG